MNEKYICFSLDIHTISEANVKEHWRKSHKRHKEQKFLTRMSLLSNRIPQNLPVKITMCRMSPRKLDSDNLQSAFKYIRDAIAEHFITGKAPGRADDDPRFEWYYDQQSSKEKYTQLRFDWH